MNFSLLGLTIDVFTLFILLGPQTVGGLTCIWLDCGSPTVVCIVEQPLQLEPTRVHLYHNQNRLYCLNALIHFGVSAKNLLIHTNVIIS